MTIPTIAQHGFFASLLFLTLASTSPAASIDISTLDLSKLKQEWSTPKAKHSIDNHPISIGGQKFENGIGTHADSVFAIDLKGGAERFTASVGVDDEVGKGHGSIEFSIYGDKKLLWKSGIMKGGDAAQPVDISVKGVKILKLRVGSGNDGNTKDHGDWADARLMVSGQWPVAIAITNTPAVVLTPKPASTPRITGPQVFGVRPGSPFLFTVTSTGDRPIKFFASELPNGLKLNPETGRITGSLNDKGEYSVVLKATNNKGTAERKLKIVVGDKIALTPPMGWNSWNCWGSAVSQEKVLSSARAMVSSGLRDHGWSYINIDDGWQGVRGGALNAIQPNSKFPGMKALADEIHELGLRFGIYSTPWEGTYLGHIGSSCNNPDGTYDWVKEGKCNEFFKYPQAPAHYRFGKTPFYSQDAQQWAEWGVDYMKYDWRPIDAAHTNAMREALLATGRDILYSLSNSAPLSGAADWAELSNCWRTTDDINDSWGSMSSIGFDQDMWAPFVGPGHWPDPDMLVVGKVGWGPSLHNTKLTPDEQYTHISLWSLLSAPLLIGCDLSQVDAFTLNLLTNDEVIDIDQDPLGKPATCIVKQDDVRIYVKELADGSRAVGIFNVGPEEADAEAKWLDLKIQGAQMVRDVWRQKDLGKFGDQFKATVPPHGVILLKLTDAK